jgi:hypothetical protein
MTKQSATYVPTLAEAESLTSYYAFMYGWHDGVHIREKQSRFTEHPTLSSFYNEGYEQGKKDVGKAWDRAAKRYGIEWKDFTAKGRRNDSRSVG